MNEDDEFEGAAGEPVVQQEYEVAVEHESLVQFASRNHLPVNQVREANLDNLDEYGNVTAPLRLP